MIRPEQISNVKFTPVSAGTYSAEEVDAFVKEVASAYKSAYDENAALVKKISILAEKVENYRKDEEAIKSALLDAHKMADSVTKSADSKASALLSDAQAKAKAISNSAEKQASDLAEAARIQAGDIVNNARTAVASLKERAQHEADKVVDSAKAKAAEIIGSANKEGDAIIGESKKEYNFYSAELEKVRTEMEKFKSMVIDLCNGKVTIPQVASFVAEEKKEETVAVEEKKPEIPVISSIPDEKGETPSIPEIPTVEAEPVAPAAEEAKIDDDEDLDDLFDLFDEGEQAPAVDFADNLDSFVPDFNQVSNDEDVDDLDIPLSAPVAQMKPETPTENEKSDNEEIDDLFNSLGIDESDDADDDDDITSLFDSLFD